MNLELLELFGLIAELIGTLTIAYAALAVNHRFRHEHKVDEAVFKTMGVEAKIAVIGIFLIVTGFCAQVFARFIL